MPTEPEKDDDPLELVPDEEAKAPARPKPPIPPEEEAPARRGPRPDGGVSEEPLRTARTKERLEREATNEDLEPPRFAWENAGEILAWPLRGEAGANVGVAFGLYLAALFGMLAAGLLIGFIASALPGFGAYLSGVVGTLLYLVGLAYLLEFAFHLVGATLRGDLAVQRVFGAGGGLPEDGLRLLVWVVAYLVPAVFVGLGTGSLLLFGILTVAGWVLIPAAVLLTAASGRIFAGNPVTAIRVVAAAGRSWLVVVVPLVPFLVVRMLPVPGLVVFLTEAISGAILVYTLLLAALLARRSPRVLGIVTDAP